MVKPTYQVSERNARSLGYAEIPYFGVYVDVSNKPSSYYSRFKINS